MWCVCVNGRWRLRGCQPVCRCKMCVAGHAMNLGVCIIDHTQTPPVLALPDSWIVTNISLCHAVACKFCQVSIPQLPCLMTLGVYGCDCERVCVTARDKSMEKVTESQIFLLFSSFSFFYFSCLCALFSTCGCVRVCVCVCASQCVCTSASVKDLLHPADLCLCVILCNLISI